jgi:hypothetical protein
MNFTLIVVNLKLIKSKIITHCNTFTDSTNQELSKGFKWAVIFCHIAPLMYYTVCKLFTTSNALMLKFHNPWGTPKYHLNDL